MSDDLEVLEQAPADGSYSRGVKIMGLGIAATGLLTFAYFSAASHALTPDQYGYVSLLWALLFIVMCVLYRPVEQLLSRSIAEQQARGSSAAPLRKAALIQVSFAALFLVAALMLRGPLQDDLLGGSSDLYWIFVSASLAYAASYFARGYFAGHKWFALYGALVFFEALARLCFPIGVLVGVATGQTAVAAGILAAPLASLPADVITIAHGTNCWTRSSCRSRSTVTAEAPQRPRPHRCRTRRAARATLGSPGALRLCSSPSRRCSTRRYYS